MVKAKPLNDVVTKPWETFLTSDVQGYEIDLFRKQERTGRPTGDESSIKMLEQLLDRNLKPQNLDQKRKISKVPPEFN